MSPSAQLNRAQRIFGLIECGVRRTFKEKKRDDLEKSEQHGYIIFIFFDCMYMLNCENNYKCLLVPK